jgi:WD40 repeat protein
VSIVSPPPPAATTAQSESPFKGLMPYSKDDARFFFGREPETEIITANLVASRLTLLYGESGVGKSSVLLAGVAHRLGEELKQNLAERGEPDFAVVVLRSWRDDPAAELVEAARVAVAEVVGDSNGLPEDGTLTEVLEASVERLNGDVLVILDQFEEYFLYHPDEDGEGTFAVEFPRAVNHRELRVNFLVSMREDALAKLDRFKGRIPSLFENRLRVDHLQVGSARAALTQPIEEYNRTASPEERFEIEPELVDDVIEQVKAGRVALGQAGGGKVDSSEHEPTNGRVEAPYLQLVMTRLWSEELASGSRVLRASTLAGCGGAERIVRTRLDDALAALPTAERDVAARVFQYLVTRSGSKIAHTPADLADYSGLPETTVTPVVEHMAGGDIRLLRPVPPPPGQDGDPRYEIFHDVLGPAVLDWRARYTQEQAKREANERARRERRRARLFGAAAVGCAVIAAAVGVLAFWAVRERHAAVEQKDTARSHELVSRATAQLDIDPAQSVALARQALELKETPQGESTLRRALSRSRVRKIIRQPGTFDAVFSTDMDSPQLLVTANARTVHVLDISTGTDRVISAPSRVYGAAISSTGDLVATAHEDGARIWNTATGEAEVLRSPKEAVYAVAFSPSGDRVATAGSGGFRIWDVDTRTELSRSQRISKDAYIDKVSFSPDGARVLTASWDFETGRVGIWDAFTAERLIPDIRYDNFLNSTEFSPDGGLVLAASEDGTAGLWDVATGREVRILEKEPRGIAWATFSPNGRLVATSHEKVARVWNATTGELVTEMQGHNDWVNVVDFRRDGNLLVTASSDGTAGVWETRTGLRLMELRGHTGDVSSARFNTDGDMVATAAADGTARLWDVSSGRELRAHNDWVLGAAVRPKSDDLLTSGADGDLYRWDSRSGERLETMFELHSGAINSVAFSFDGAKFVTTGADGTAEVREATSSDLVTYLFGHTGQITAASFSPDGKQVLTASADWTARIWDAETGKEKRNLVSKKTEFETTHDGQVADATFAANGKRIVTVSVDQTARVWDAANGNELRTFSGHEGVVASVDVHPVNDALILTGAWDGTARVWNVETGRQVAKLSQPEKMTAATFSPNGKWIVTGGPQGVTRVWDWRGQKLLAEMKMHADYINSAIFTPDGRIVTTSDDRTARMYTCGACVPLDDLLQAAEERERGLRATSGG